MDPEVRVALVTGASSGLGHALARILALEDGYAVGLVARRRERLETLAREIQDAGGRALACPADVADRDALRLAIDAAVRAFGPIDLLVANAGLVRGTDALAPDAAAFELELRVNLFGVFYAIEAVVPSMRERGRGHVVAVSSLAGRRGFPGSGGYCASKAALTRLMESLRLDWPGAGIRATTIHPGFVETAALEGRDAPTPFLMGVDKAARKMARAIRRGKKVYDFPWQTALLSRFAPLIPDAILRRASR